MQGANLIIECLIKEGVTTMFGYPGGCLLYTSWELIEFGLDRYLGFDCQAGGLTDTMFDILDCLIGSIIATIYYYFKIRKAENIKR